MESGVGGVGGVGGTTVFKQKNALFLLVLFLVFRGVLSGGSCLESHATQSLSFPTYLLDECNFSGKLSIQ